MTSIINCGSETKTCTSGPRNTQLLPTRLQCEKTIHTQGNSTTLPHIHVYAQCKTMAILVAHLPLSKKGRATVVADYSSLHQASEYNTSCMIYTNDFLNNAHRDSKHCKCVASLYKPMENFKMP